MTVTAIWSTIPEDAVNMTINVLVKEGVFIRQSLGSPFLILTIAVPQRNGTMAVLSDSKYTV